VQHPVRQGAQVREQHYVRDCEENCRTPQHLWRGCDLPAVSLNPDTRASCISKPWPTGTQVEGYAGADDALILVDDDPLAGVALHVGLLLQPHSQ